MDEHEVIGRTEDGEPITRFFILNLHRVGLNGLAEYYVHLYCAGFTYDFETGTVATRVTES